MPKVTTFEYSGNFRGIRLSRRFRRRLRHRYHLLSPQDPGVLLSRETFSAVNIRAGEEYTIQVKIDLN